jgi:hypothetical protein
MAWYIVKSRNGNGMQRVENIILPCYPTNSYANNAYSHMPSILYWQKKLGMRGSKHLFSFLDHVQNIYYNG